ncbi:MAG: hypothetical protein NVS3B21_00480 [Acidimicrobiales bacterium]
MLGLAEAQMVGHAGLDFVEAGDGARLRERVTSAPDIGVQDFELRLRHADGSLRDFEGTRTDLVADPDIGGIVWNLRDATSKRRADTTLRESESRYRSIVETATEGIWIHDVNGRTTFANPKMAALLATTAEALVGRSLFDFVDPADWAVTSSKLARRRTGLSDRYEFTLRRTDGTAVDVLISASALRDAEGQVSGVLKMVTDISDRKAAEAQKARLALEDPLTGLASRALVVDRVTQLLAKQQREPGLAAVLFLDLDNFKQVNDSLGHIVGDQLLCDVAGRIRGAVRPQDTVGRFGGDEFVVVLDDLSSPADAVSAAERVLDALRGPTTLEGTEVVPTASIGVALTPALDATALLRDADVAMYRAKERGGGRHELFDAGLRARVMARLELEADMRRALERDEFRVHYQPVVALDGRICGLEALVRWQHPTRGLVSPGEFIPLAESTGLIVALGAKVLDEACADLARWRGRPGHEALTMAVNLSGRQLVGSAIAAQVAATLTAHDLEPEALWLEITESVLMDDTAAATAALSAIHDLGVRLAVDDFGTGYSSLLYLRRFPVDALKLDRFFVAGIDRNDQDSAIVRAVIDLAHSLGLCAIAEGVEVPGQLDALSAMGCDLAQGFYWSPAVPAASIDHMLEEVAVGPAAHATEQVPPPRLPQDGSSNPPDRPSVLIVDDSDGERSLLYNHLEASGWFRVVADAADAERGIELAALVQPDLVVLDMAMTGMDGLEALPLLLRSSPLSRVVILSGFVSAGLRNQATSAGAAAVVEKSCDYDAIVDALRIHTRRTCVEVASQPLTPFVVAT